MKRILVTIISFSLLVSLIALPIDTKAKTIAEFEAEVTKFTNELNAKKANLAKNDAEVAQIKKEIASAEKQIKEAEAEILTLQNEIDASNLEIRRKSEESKAILEYYQISNGENIYLEYAFGASNITDMIYRMSIVEQLTDYNDKIMKELEELIAKNKQQQEALTVKKKNLANLKVQLNAKKARIEADSEAIIESMPSIETQIKEAQSQVTYFKNLGCGKNEDIQACQFRIAQAAQGSLPSVGYFSRPMAKGYVTQKFHSGHIGYDFSSSNKTEPIYPIAEGVVHHIYTDNCTGSNWCSQMGTYCKGNAKIVVTKHNYNEKYYYVAYVHLSSYGNISVGQYVSRNTVIGYMGNTGCSTGAHLHMEISTCHWANNGGCTSSGYNQRMVNPSSLMNFPSSWTVR